MMNNNRKHLANKGFIPNLNWQHLNYKGSLYLTMRDHLSSRVFKGLLTQASDLYALGTGRKVGFVQKTPEWRGG